MPTTANFGLPYSAHTDPPQGNAQIQALAEAVDAALNIRSAKKFALDAEQTTTSTTFAEMGTPDRVDDIVVETDGLLLIAYSALWQQVSGVNGAAALFLDTNQIKGRASGSAAPTVQQVAVVTSDAYTTLATDRIGLISGTGGTGMSSDVTTGQIVGVDTGGGFCLVKVAAGTYDVGVRFKAPTGAGSPVPARAIKVKERRLWVASLTFD